MNAHAKKRKMQHRKPSGSEGWPCRMIELLEPGLRGGRPRLFRSAGKPQRVKSPDRQHLSQSRPLSINRSKHERIEVRDSGRRNGRRLRGETTGRSWVAVWGISDSLGGQFRSV